MLQTPVARNTLEIGGQCGDTERRGERQTCVPLSIDEVIRVVDSAIRIGLEAEPLPVGGGEETGLTGQGILDSLTEYMGGTLEKMGTQPPAYAPPSPPVSPQHSTSASVSSGRSENQSSGSSMTVSEMVGQWLTSERAYVIELSVFQELLLRGALVKQMRGGSEETVSRCISIFITASSSIINVCVFGGEAYLTGSRRLRCTCRRSSCTRY
ncbi:hypothetical protein PMAC_001392 [Pneumocystis sp. 'macacae']|nr:hypothetical protein PMAC_001392 [Pneumocystis sp. 'macacae']